MTISPLLVFGSGVLAGTVVSAIVTRSLQPQEQVPEVVKRGREILKYGSPNSGPAERYYDNHVLQYDQARKTPLWVAEHLTAHNLKGKAKRKEVKFKPDPSIETVFSATNKDYWDSGWSRGHMAPAGDNKCSQDAMEQTFYLSNILPQDIKNNGGFWNRFEMYCRDLTKKFDSVRVISGPVMLPATSKGKGDGMDEKKLVTYQVIGESEVAVPTHLYKLIVAENASDATPAMAAFIVPNIPISFDHSLKEYQVPLDSLEKHTGLRLVPDLDRSAAPDLCTLDPCKLMSRDAFDLFTLEHRIWSANNRKKLEKVWSVLEQKNLEPTEQMKATYRQKMAEFEKDGKTETEVMKSMKS